MSLDELAVWLKTHGVRCEVSMHRGLWSVSFGDRQRAIERIGYTLHAAIAATMEAWDA